MKKEKENNMKKISVGIISVLVIVALVLSMNVIASALDEKEKENEDSLKKVQNEALLYKQQLTELEKLYDALKSEQYVNYKEYEEKISQLELKLADKNETVISEISKSDAQYTYTVFEDGITITKYVGSDKTLYVPTSIDGIDVVAIGKEAFKSATFCTVILPQGIKKIDWFAFADCKDLESIEFPDSIEKIEYGVFDGITDFVITCSQNSYAYKYAKSYGYNIKTK